MVVCPGISQTNNEKNSILDKRQPADLLLISFTLFSHKSGHQVVAHNHLNCCKLHQCKTNQGILHSE